MSDLPNHLKYTKEHEWLEIDGDTATIGITDHAQAALGDLVFVELPEVGASVSAGDDFAVVESVKAASEVYTPVSGEVLEVNEDLTDQPEAINEHPYTDGWIARVKLSDKSELDETMDAEEYGKYLEKMDS